MLLTRWRSDENFHAESDAYLPVAAPDAEGMDIREWEMEPGDAVGFNDMTLHGACGNEAATRRRAFSVRLVGDDACHVERPSGTKARRAETRLA